MGSNRFQVRERGKTMQEAFDTAQAKAEDEYGHQQGYSGQINMACGCVDITDKYVKSDKEDGEFIEDAFDNSSKHSPAMAICRVEPKGNNNVIKSQVKHHVFKGTRKWELRYEVYVDEFDARKIGSEKMKASAVEKARKYTEKHQTSTYVQLARVLVGSDKDVATITYKKAKGECEGEWLFIGHASD